MSFGFWEAILAHLTRQIGLRTDAADAAGSLHAKVKNINDNTLPTLQKPRGPAGAYGSFSTTLTTYQTALNITNTKGRLVALQALKASAGESGQVGVRLTVDGYVLSDTLSPSVTATTAFFPTPAFLFTTGSTAGGLDTVVNGGRALLGINFKTSLKIEVKYVTGGDAASVSWVYETE